MLMPPKPTRWCVRVRVVSLVGAVLAIAGCAQGGTPTTSGTNSSAGPTDCHLGLAALPRADTRWLIPENAVLKGQKPSSAWVRCINAKPM